MNTCIFTFSSTSKNMSEIGNIHIFFDEFYDGIMKIGNTNYSKILSNVYFTSTENVKMCKIYGDWKLAYFTVQNVYITLIRADKCIFSKVHKCSDHVKFNKIEFQEIFKINEKD